MGICGSRLQKQQQHQQHRQEPTTAAPHRRWRAKQYSTRNNRTKSATSTTFTRSSSSTSGTPTSRSCSEHEIPPTETSASPATPTNKAGLDEDRRTSTPDVLPDELLRSSVFSFLDATSLARAGCACRVWEEASLDEHLWKALCLRHWAGKHVGVYKQ